MSNPSTILRVATLAAVVASSVALAAPRKYELTDLGLRFSWPKGPKATVSVTGQDKTVSATRAGIELKAIVRQGIRLPAEQHQFRLMSYFTGEWRKEQEACRGTGWDGCEAWSWDSETGNKKGMALAGYGNSGTYLIVLTAPTPKFKKLRPKMRALQESIELF